MDYGRAIGIFIPVRLSNNVIFVYVNRFWDSESVHKYIG